MTASKFSKKFILLCVISIIMLIIFLVIFWFFIPVEEHKISLTKKENSSNVFIATSDVNLNEFNDKKIDIFIKNKLECANIMKIKKIDEFNWEIQLKFDRHIDVQKLKNIDWVIKITLKQFLTNYLIHLNN